MVKQIKVTIIDNISATTTENQIPFSLKNIGKMVTAKTWKSSVLKNEISAETKPLFNAVKKPEPKIFTPKTKKEMAKILNA